MAIADLKEQLKDQSIQLIEKIKESTVFNLAKEKFDLLPQNSQRVLLVGIIFFCDSNCGNDTLQLFFF